MTRLQKKCLIAAAGTHLLVVVAIHCSGFIRPTPKQDDTTLLDVIPANLVDAALNSGVKNAQPPAPAPPQPPQPPTPQVQQPTPTPPTPTPPKPQTLVEKVEKTFTPEKPPVDNTPAELPKPQKQHQIDVNLKPVVRNASKPTDTSAADAKAAKKLADERRKAFAAAARAIKDNASSPTTVDVAPGNSSVSYANYAQAVKSIYDQAWTAPDSAASDDSDVLISTTIANDGHVIESHIITPSGDASVDASVQHALDRVTFVASFPEGATEKQRTFKIYFNLKAKRMLE